MYGIKNTAAVMVLSGMGLLAAGATANAQDFGHIDRLALQLERQGKDLHREVHSHFRLLPSYKHLDRDVAEMERLARHLHEVAHHGGSVGHLRSDVEKLDRLYHHVDDQIRRMAVTGRLDLRTVQHFRRAMSRINTTLHHLRDDLAHLDVYDHHGHGAIYLPGFRIDF